MAYPYYNTDGSLSEFAWRANREYFINQVVRANPSKENTLAFRCIERKKVAPGERPRSASADVYEGFIEQEPAFPFKITQTLQDGDIVWQAFEPLAEELLRLTPTAIIDLFEIVLTPEINSVPSITTFRYHSGKNGLSEDVKFGGETYTAVPVEVDGFEFSSKGALPRPTIRIGNINNGITYLLISTNPLAAKVRRIRTFAKFIDTANFADGVNPLFARSQDIDDILTTQDGKSLSEQTEQDTADPDAKLVETWYIDRVSSENPEFVEFELTPKLDLTNLALPRRTIEEFCPWTYRNGIECPYVDDACFTIDDQPITTGTLDERLAADICGKKLSSCQARFNREKLPFGGFYGARLQA